MRRLRDGTLNLEHLAPGAGEPEARRGRRKAGTGGRGAATAEPAEARQGQAGRGGAAVRRRSRSRWRRRLFTSATSRSSRRSRPTCATSTSPCTACRTRPASPPRSQAGLRAVPGGTLTEHGTLRLSRSRPAARVAVDDVELGRFAPYYQQAGRLRHRRRARVRLGAQLPLRAGQRRGPRCASATGSVDLADLALRRRGARDDFFQLAALGVHGADAGSRRAHGERRRDRHARRARARGARRAAASSICRRWCRRRRPPATRRAAARAASPPRRRPASPGLDGRRGALRPRKWGVRFEDRAVTPTASLTVDPIALHVTKLSTAPGAKLGVDLRLGVNKTGRIQMTGTSTLPPVAANLRFDLRALEICPFQPYFPTRSSLTVTGGHGRRQGAGGASKVATWRAAAADERQRRHRRRRSGHRRSRQARAAGRLEARSTSVGLHVVDAADGGRDRRGGARRPPCAPGDGRRRASQPAGRVRDAGRAAAREDRRRPTKQREGRRRPKPRRAAAAAARRAAMPIAIGKLILAGRPGHLHRSLDPARIHRGDRATSAGASPGLSSVGGHHRRRRPARRRSTALARWRSPARSTRWPRTSSLDVQVSLNDVELPPAQPVQRANSSATRSARASWISPSTTRSPNRKLDAKNKLVLDQFTFGDKVDSPDAVEAARAPGGGAAQGSPRRHRRRPADRGLARRSEVQGVARGPEGAGQPGGQGGDGAVLVDRVGVRRRRRAVAHRFRGRGRRRWTPAAQKRLATPRQGAAGAARASRSRSKGGADPKRDREGLRRLPLRAQAQGAEAGRAGAGGRGRRLARQAQIDAAERPRCSKRPTRRRSSRSRRTRWVSRRACRQPRWRS